MTASQPCSFVVQHTNQSAATPAMWRLACVSLISFAYYFWGGLTTILVSPLVLVPWVRVELGLSKKTARDVLLGWWKSQVHLYSNNRISASIPLDSIISVRVINGFIGPGEFIRLPLPWFCEVLINTKSCVHICRFGPLPIHVILRIRRFAITLEKKRVGYYDSITAPELDSI